MPAIAHSLRVPETLEREIQREIARRGARDWSSGVLSLLDEAVRVSRAPGIVFVDSNRERRAALAFSGLEIWEIIRFWKGSGEKWEEFREQFEELSEQQLRAAVNYYRLYPEEIDARLAKEDYWTEERIAAEFPFTQSRVKEAQ